VCVCVRERERETTDIINGDGLTRRRRERDRETRVHGDGRTESERVREETREYQSSNEVTAAAYSARTRPGGSLRYESRPRGS